jgi:RimJ/RimL family protein N-acetyltransferase
MSVLSSTNNVVERAVRVLREEGIKSFCFKLLGEIGYRRYLLLERSLEEPIPHAETHLPITIELLKKAEADEYSMFRVKVRPSEIVDRLNAGQWCFVARHEGKLISGSWAGVHTARSYYLNREIRLGQDEVYVYGSFTKPDFRGLFISPTIKVAMMRYFRDTGYRRMICWVSPENRPSLKALQKVGFRPLGIMGYLKIGPWRRDFYRTGNKLQDEGLRNFWFKLLSGIGCYRRLLLLERLLDDPVPDIKLSLPVTIDLLEKTELDEYLAFRAKDDPSLIAGWLKAGHWCFVARHEGQLVSASWAAIHRARNFYLTREVHLMPDEVYIYDSFTKPNFRGKSISAAIRAGMIQYFRAAGYRRMILGTQAENKSNLRTLRKVGFRPFGMMGYIKVGPWRRDFYRTSKCNEGLNE